MTATRRIYISGPMTGIEDHNFPAFHAAADRFRKAGWEVANPAENFGGRTDLARETYLRADVALLSRCDAIAMLPGWQSSRGAMFEYAIALELEMAVYDAETMNPVAPESVLDTARRITAGSRQADYGHPADDFAKTAAMWTGIFAGRLREGAAVTAMDVPLCMIAVKLARQVHRHKRDNLVDIAGYARTASMVAGDE
ncbi:MAG: DUF4406 domain-containing protein [Planctomycetota bacterium]|nr:DUF4406 domain-containing protein [Planctomycetota bacterium]